MTAWLVCKWSHDDHYGGLKEIEIFGYKSEGWGAPVVGPYSCRIRDRAKDAVAAGQTHSVPGEFNSIAAAVREALLELRDRWRVYDDVFNFEWGTGKYNVTPLTFKSWVGNDSR